MGVEASARVSRAMVVRAPHRGPPTKRDQAAGRPAICAVAASLRVAAEEVRGAGRLLRADRAPGAPPGAGVASVLPGDDERRPLLHRAQRRSSQALSARIRPGRLAPRGRRSVQAGNSAGGRSSLHQAQRRTRVVRAVDCRTWSSSLSCGVRRLGAEQLGVRCRARGRGSPAALGDRLEPCFPPFSWRSSLRRRVASLGIAEPDCRRPLRPRLDAAIGSSVRSWRPAARRAPSTSSRTLGCGGRPLAGPARVRRDRWDCDPSQGSSFRTRHDRAMRSLRRLLPGRCPDSRCPGVRRAAAVRLRHHARHLAQGRGAGRVRRTSFPTSRRAASAAPAATRSRSCSRPGGSSSMRSRSRSLSAALRAGWAGVTIDLPEADEARQVLVFTPCRRRCRAGSYHARSAWTGGSQRQRPKALHADPGRVTSPSPRVLLATEMEPSNARRLLPCWDEPSFRARFRLSVDLPPGFAGYSNMPAERRGGACRAAGCALPPAPTHADVELPGGALVAGELERVTAEADGTELGRRRHRGQGGSGAVYALEAGRQLLPTTATISAPAIRCPKLDQIGVPGGFWRGDGELGRDHLHRGGTVLVDPASSPEQTPAGCSTARSRTRSRTSGSATW